LSSALSPISPRLGVCGNSAIRSGVVCRMILILLSRSQACLPTFTAAQDEEAPSTSPRSMASMPSVEAG
jgi:hypothetical protein